MFAVVKTGGKQYRVTPGDVIVVEKIIGETGDKVKLDQILMIDEGEKELKIGSPIVAGVAVNCIVLDQSRTDKILVFKKKRRQGYKRTKGHRQDQTVLRIIDINGKGALPAKPAKNQATKEKPESSSETTPTESELTTKKKSPVKKAASKKKAITKKTSAKKKSATKKKSTSKNKTSKS